MITHTIYSPTLNISGLQLIQRLPDELLPVIFHEAKVPLKISQVCRGWRAIALDHPTLWTILHVDHSLSGIGYGSYICSTGLLNIFLARSRSAPLFVELTTCYVVGMEDSTEEEDLKKCNCMVNLKLIANHIPHIKKLKIRCDTYYSDYDVSEVLQGAFSTHPAPILESLEYSTHDEIWLNDLKFYPRVAPALRRLRLNDAIISWKTPIFQNLTELYINLRAPHDFSRGGRLMKIRELFSTLQACPGLTVLFLRSCLPDVKIPSNDLRTINLPSIKEIFLRNLPVSTCLLIAQSIRVPPQANWYIEDKFPSETSVQNACALLRDVAAKVEIAQSRELVLVLQCDVISLFSSHFAQNDVGLKKKRKSIFSASFELNKQEELLSNIQSASRIPILQIVAQIISALNLNNNIFRLTVRFKSSRYHYCESGEIGCIVNESLLWIEPILLALPRRESLGLKLFCSGRTDNTEEQMYYHKIGFMEGGIRSLTPTSEPLEGDSKEALCPNLRCVEIAYGKGHLSENLLRCLKMRSDRGIPVHSVKLEWFQDPFALGLVSKEWLAEAEKVSNAVSIEIQPEKEYWDHVFSPSYERSGDDSNGSFRGYFEYDYYHSHADIIDWD